MWITFGFINQNRDLKTTNTQFHVKPSKHTRYTTKRCFTWNNFQLGIPNSCKTTKYNRYQKKTLLFHMKHYRPYTPSLSYLNTHRFTWNTKQTPLLLVSHETLITEFHFLLWQPSDTSFEPFSPPLTCFMWNTQKQLRPNICIINFYLMSTLFLDFFYYHKISFTWN